MSNQTENNTDPSVNVYFSKANNQIESSGNVALDHIVLQNTHYHKENDELKTELIELKQLNEELEADNGSLETSKTCLKGYIKNETESNKYYRELVGEYDRAIREVSTYHKQILIDLQRFVPAVLVLQVSIVLGILKFSHTWNTGFLTSFSILTIDIVIGLLEYQITPTIPI